jgi:hypothetical protein
MRETVSVFCSWLELTPVSKVLQSVEWVIPAVQTVHLLAIAAVMGATLLLNLRLLGVRETDAPLARVSSRFVPVIWVSILVLLSSGVVMIAAEPARSLLNPAFQLKMAMLAAVLCITAVTVRPLRNSPGYWGVTPVRRGLARSSAIVSSGLWVGVLFAGRWIAYMGVH